MQSFSSNNKARSGKMYENLKAAHEGSMEAFKQDTVTHTHIGRIPNNNSEVEINGLKYKVTQVNRKKGKLQLELIR